MDTISPAARSRFKVQVKQTQDSKSLKTVLFSYSRRVKLLRWILPFCGVILLGLIIAWPSVKPLFEERYDDIPPISKKMVLENRLVKPKLIETDDKNQPVAISADSSVQIQENRSDLEKPQGKFKTDQGTDVEITSDEGRYNQENGILNYEKNVTLTTSDGYVFKTDRAQMHVKTQIANGDDPIRGQGPAGQIEASEGFEIDKKSKTLQFKGKTKLILNDSKKSTP